MQNYNNRSAIGEKGVLYLRCKVCKSVWTTFLRERQISVACRCGCTVELDSLARFEYTCPNCGRHTYGHTNIEDADINICCKCGNFNILEWHPKYRAYME